MGQQNVREVGQFVELWYTDWTAVKLDGEWKELKGGDYDYRHKIFKVVDTKDTSAPEYADSTQIKNYGPVNTRLVDDQGRVVWTRNDTSFLRKASIPENAHEFVEPAGMSGGYREYCPLDPREIQKRVDNQKFHLYDEVVVTDWYWMEQTSMSRGTSGHFEAFRRDEWNNDKQKSFTVVAQNVRGSTDERNILIQDGDGIQYYTNQADIKLKHPSVV